MSRGLLMSMKRNALVVPALGEQAAVLVEPVRRAQDGPRRAAGLLVELVKLGGPHGEELELGRAVGAVLARRSLPGLDRAGAVAAGPRVVLLGDGHDVAQAAERRARAGAADVARPGAQLGAAARVGAAERGADALLAARAGALAVLLVAGADRPLHLRQQLLARRAAARGRAGLGGGARRRAGDRAGRGLRRGALGDG